MKIGLLIQYDGTAYHGWQVQLDPDTIQGHLERALEVIFEQKLGLIGSGRTDSGVHAMGQVAHFSIEESHIPATNICMALNRQLPRDLRVIASQEVKEQFHSRFAAIRREYRYQINLQPNVLTRHSHWHIKYHLDVEQLHELSKRILGQHDFSSFCFAGTETENMVCNIYASGWTVGTQGDLIFNIQGDRFLHHMVRMLVGCMIEVARGKWSIATFHALLDEPNRKSFVITAPAKGLALMKVSYPEDIEPLW